MKVEPSPTAEVTSIHPPIAWVKSFEMYRPKPNPSVWVRLLSRWWNRSKTRPTSDSGIPEPRSTTSNETVPSAGAPAKHHRRTGRRELDGVVHEVREDLDQTVGVGHHPNRGVGPFFDLDEAAASPSPFVTVLEQLSNLDLGRFERQLARFDPGNHQEILDQADQPIRLREHDAQVLVALIDREVASATPQHVDEASDPR